MAASQMECLEDSEARPWPSGSNPRHVYSEGQRRALEALLEEGDASYWSCLQREGIRPFLSAGEASRFQRRALARGPGTPEPAGPQPAPEDEGRPVPSLTYWPLHTDDGAPCLALGWPEGGMWKGITRGTVYTHPPAEGAPTIKEVVRNLLQSAKQVIAVVMDLFTDIDVFVDIVEAASARRVPAYILVGERSLPQFIAMARGYPTDLRLLENVQVRGLSGCTFCSRNGKKVTGDVKERFLLVDGETVITGSYSFTWSDARLDRNLATLLTGQVVDAFDWEFRTLYAASRPLCAGDFCPAGSQEDNASPCPMPPLPAQTLRGLRTPQAPRMPTPLRLANAATRWRGARAPTEAAQALSDILRRARQAGAASSAPPPKASKSLWDLSALSQLSGSSWGTGSAQDQMELGDDARSRHFKAQATPAATLMKQRDAHKDEELLPRLRAPRTFYPGRPPGHGPSRSRWHAPGPPASRTRAGGLRPSEE